ncbi:MAG: glycine-rich protein [Planctomycetota bacterium]
MQRLLIRIITVMGLIACGSYDGGVSSAPTETPPAQVTSPSPSNKAINVPLTQQLGWGAASGAASYNVYFGTSVTPQFVITTTSTTYKPGALTNKTIYYWRIDSKNTAGTTTGDMWSFTTAPTASPLTFNYTGGQQKWVVPTGVTTIKVDVRGAQGGNGYTADSDGGNGAQVQTTLAVKPTEILYIYVGGQGSRNGSGGYNGGGSSGAGTYASGGGGGASDIRQGGTALSNRVVVAGGGGGGGYSGGGYGGYVAGGQGGIGSLGSTGGDGGTQSAGGAGGYSTGTDGTIGVGGNSGSGDLYCGGGGGGGYYGGGGGGGAIGGMGSSAGGGGSGYSAGTDTSYAEGFQTGNGLIIITYGPSAAQVTTPNPSNRTTGVSINTTLLSWAAASDATSYDIYFGASWPVTFITNRTDTTYNPGILLNNTVYFWRIDSKNAIGTTIGIVWVFNTALSGAPPVQVTTPSPANGATGIPITRQLKWTAAKGATSYDVYLGTSSPGMFIGNQTDTSYTPNTLSYNTTYYWRIDSRNAGGTITGTIWNFTTVAEH